MAALGPSSPIHLPRVSQPLGPFGLLTEGQVSMFAMNNAAAHPRGVEVAETKVVRSAR